MDKTQYFANLRQINKMEAAIKEWDIQILELECSLIDKELKELFLQEKLVKQKIDEWNLKRMREIVEKTKPVG